MTTMYMDDVRTLSSDEIDDVFGGTDPITAGIVLGIALAGLALTAFNSGYNAGKDAAQRDNRNDK